MSEPIHQDVISIIDYWNIVWRKKVVVITLFIVTVIITLIISLLLPKYYKSEAMIMALAPDSGGLSAALSSSPFGAIAGSFGGLSTPADKILVLLKSRTIAEIVIKKFDLQRVFNDDEWDAAKGTWKNPNKPPLMEDTLKKLEKDITIFKKSKEGAITISVEWKDPILASHIANYYVTALVEFMKDKSVNTTVQIIDPAVPAEKKSWPKVGLNIALAAVMSLFIGVFIALFLENLSRHHKT